MKLSLKTDIEFKNLSPLITDTALEALEETLFDGGCREPIATWNSIIIDGHKRYEICKKWDIPFNIKKLCFENRHEAIIWLCKQNYSAESQADEYKKYIIGKHYEAEKALFLLTYTEKRAPRYHYKIATDLAVIYNVVPNTVYKYGIYARCLDNIAEKEPEIIPRILSGKLKISHDNIVELSRLPKEYIRRLNTSIAESNVEHIGYSDMRHELQWKAAPPITRTAPSRTQKSSANNDVAIKKMPEYDPDAEISSLTLTIPSWISSIQRTQSIADLPLVSDSARQKIRTQLVNLSITINEMLTAIEEEI